MGSMKAERCWSSRAHDDAIVNPLPLYRLQASRRATDSAEELYDSVSQAESEVLWHRVEHVVFSSRELRLAFDVCTDQHIIFGIVNTFSIDYVNAYESIDWWLNTEFKFIFYFLESEFCNFMREFNNFERLNFCENALCKKRLLVMTLMSGGWG